MSRTAAEALVSAYVEAFNQGDSAAILALLDDDVIHDINQGGREIGAEAFRWAFAARRGHFRERIENLVVMSNESGTHAAAEFTLKGEYVASIDGLPKANGQRYALAAGMFFEIEDGHITRVTENANLADWRAQISAE